MDANKFHFGGNFWYVFLALSATHKVAETYFTVFVMQLTDLSLGVTVGSVISISLVL